jgi:SGNH hydrolase-like domain, acetyltransferase AlgX
LITNMPGGDVMVFAREHIKEPAEALIRREIDYFKWLDRQLAQDGLKLVVLLIPRAYIVYGELVTPPVPNQVALVHCRDLENRLEAEGIAFVSTIEVFRREARARLPQREYLYHLDDSHWNARGISVAVDEFLRTYPAADWPDCRPSQRRVEPGKTAQVPPNSDQADAPSRKLDPGATE